MTRRRSSHAVADPEAAATREAFQQAARGEVTTWGTELMERIAETGEVPEFVRDPA